MTESVFTYAAPGLKFGRGASDEIGWDVQQLVVDGGGRGGASRVLLVTDPGVAATGHPERVADGMRSRGLDGTVFDRARVEPTDASMEDAIAFAREQPGLVFGLTRGGSCRGMAFEVARADWPEVRAYLDTRELVTSVYRDVMRPIQLDDGRRVTALTYLVDETHEQFAGELSIDQQLAMISAGIGISGRNVDYVLNTARHLEQLGIRDRALMALAQRLEALSDQAA